MQVSVLVSSPGPEDALAFANLVRWSPAHRLWQGHSLLTDALQQFAHAAGAGVRVPTGLGVSLAPLRPPYLAAAEVRSLALLTGRSVVAAFGPGSPELQRAVLGAPYERPLAAMGEYVAMVRALLDGRTVDHVGEVHRLHAALSPCPRPDVRIGLGVLRPRMAELAGAVADVAVTWLTPATYLAEVVVPALRRGAEERVEEGAASVTAVVPIAVDRPGVDPREVAAAGSAQHLAAPHYRDMLARAGVRLGDDPAAAAAGLVEGGGLLHGSPDDIVDALVAYADAGADEVVLNTVGVAALGGREAALADLGEVLGAWRRRTGDGA